MFRTERLGAWKFRRRRRGEISRLKQFCKANPGESVYPGIRAVRPTLIDQMKKQRRKSCYPVPDRGKCECGFG
jgi:hypothetical protein